MVAVPSLGHRQTYEPIVSLVLPFAITTSVTISNIPQNYTDLVLVTNSIDTGFAGMVLQVNGETSGTNYSYTSIFGDGSNTSYLRLSNQSGMNLGLTDTSQTINVFNFLNYSSTNMFKTILGSGNATARQVRRSIGLWRSTSAITSISISNALQPGSTLNLYGIKAAA